MIFWHSTAKVSAISSLYKRPVQNREHSFTIFWLGPPDPFTTGLMCSLKPTKYCKNINILFNFHILWHLFPCSCPLTLSAPVTWLHLEYEYKSHNMFLHWSYFTVYIQNCIRLYMNHLSTERIKGKWFTIKHLRDNWPQCHRTPNTVLKIYQKQCQKAVSKQIHLWLFVGCDVKNNESVLPDETSKSNKILLQNKSSPVSRKSESNQTIPQKVTVASAPRHRNSQTCIVKTRTGFVFTNKSVYCWVTAFKTCMF